MSLCGFAAAMVALGLDTGMQPRPPCLHVIAIIRALPRLRVGGLHSGLALYYQPGPLRTHRTQLAYKDFSSSRTSSVYSMSPFQKRTSVSMGAGAGGAGPGGAGVSEGDPGEPAGGEKSAGRHRDVSARASGAVIMLGCS